MSAPAAPVAWAWAPAHDQRSGVPLQWGRPGTGAALRVQEQPPRSWGTPPLELLRGAALREARLVVQRARRPRPQVVRLPAAALRTGVRASARCALAGGALLAWPSDTGRTVLHDVLTASGATPTGAARSTSNGALLVPCVHDGTRAFLRVGLEQSPADPAGAASALVRVAAAGPEVPRLLGRGATSGASWSLERAVPGTRPADLSAALLADVVQLLVALPRGAPAAPAEGLSDVLHRLLPQYAGAAQVRERRCAEVLSHWGHTTVHGDLWSGNLLVRHGRLSGLLDWDACHARGTAGTDLLHLLATQQRVRGRAAMGAVYLSAPWRSAAFTGAAAPYWRLMGLSPSPAQLDAVGADWWAGQVAGDLRRRPGLAAWPAWVEANVRCVLESPLP
jgi:hypothetical protein